MTDKERKAIADYCARRDAMLVLDSVDALIAFHEQENIPQLSSREVAEITLRKAQSAVRSLPSDLRMRASVWLKERGYESWADPEVHH